MDAKKLHASLILALMVSVPGLALAQTVGDLAEIQAETLILRAQAAKAEAAKKVRDAGAEGAGAASGQAEGVPVVRGIFGPSNALYATFLYADGSTVDARLGQSVPGGYVVRTLTPSRVELTRGGRRYTLGFSDLRPVAPSAPAGAAPGFPAPISPVPFGG